MSKTQAWQSECPSNLGHVPEFESLEFPVRFQPDLAFQARAGTLGRAPLGHIRTFITNLNPEPRVFLLPLDRGQDQTSNRKKVVCHFDLHHLFINFNT